MVFLSSCDRDLRNLSSCLREVKSPFKLRGVRGIALESLQENHALSCIWGENSWCFLRCSRKLWAPLELRRGPQGPARIPSGKSSLHSSCERPLGIPLQSVQGHRASSRFEAGTSGFLSSSDIDLGVPMEFEQGSQASSRVETWNSISLSMFQRGVRIPVEWT